LFFDDAIQQQPTRGEARQGFVVSRFQQISMCSLLITNRDDAR
jgi:hypothetical protein